MQIICNGQKKNRKKEQRDVRSLSQAAAERAALGIPPLPLNAQQTADLVELLKNPPAGEGEFLVELLAHRVPPGVDDAAKVKASFLAAVAEGSASSPLVSPEYATELLGTMLGGYNIHALIELLDNDKLAPIAAKGLKHTLLMFDSFHDVQEKPRKAMKYAQEVLQSWADAGMVYLTRQSSRKNYRYRLQS